MGVNYLDVKRYFESNRYSTNKARIYCNMLFKIEEFIDVNTMKLFYPKNLFVDDKDLEPYLVFEDKMLRVKVLENNNIEITALKFRDLTDFNCECLCDPDGFHRLTMKFKNGVTVVFDNLEDTNTSWSHKFEKLIKDLLKHLIQNY